MLPLGIPSGWGWERACLSRGLVISRSSTVAVLNNPGYPANAPPGTEIGPGAQVSGAGPQGPAGQDFVLSSPLPINLGGTGQATASDAFNALSPLFVPGQMIGFNGLNNVAAPLPFAEHQIIFSDSTTPVGFRWASQSELVIPFNSIAPSGALGSLIVNNGSGYVSLPAAANGYVLSSNSTVPDGIKWIPAVFNTFSRTLVGTSPWVLSGSEDVLGVHMITPGPVSIILAAVGLYVNQFIMIKDELGDADTNNITITTSDGTTIEGNSSYVINQPYGHVWIYSDGTNFQVF